MRFISRSTCCAGSRTSRGFYEFTVFSAESSACSNKTNPEALEMLILGYSKYLDRNLTRIHTNFKTGPGFPPERFDNPTITQ